MVETSKSNEEDTQEVEVEEIRERNQNEIQGNEKQQVEMKKREDFLSFRTSKGLENGYIKDIKMRHENDTLSPGAFISKNEKQNKGSYASRLRCLDHPIKVLENDEPNSRTEYDLSTMV